MKDYSQNMKLAILATSVLAVIVVSFLSYYTGDFSLEVIYAQVILLLSWYAGRLQGLSVAILSGAGIILGAVLDN